MALDYSLIIPTLVSIVLDAFTFFSLGKSSLAYAVETDLTLYFLSFPIFI